MPRLLLLAALAALASGTAAAQSVLYVDADATGAGDGSSWTDAYPSLADGLAAAGSGDAVWVAEGTYYPDEGGAFADDDRAASFLMPPNVTIYGGFDGTEAALEDRDWVVHPVILSGDLDQDGTLAGNSVHVVHNLVEGDDSFSPTADAGMLDGVTITGGNADGSVNFVDNGGGGIRLYLARMTVRNARITGNAAGFTGGGILVDQGGGASGDTETANVTLVNVVFDHNAATYGGGLRVRTGNGYLTNVTFAQNSGVIGCAAYIDDNSIYGRPSFIRNAIAWDQTCSNTPADFGGIGYTVSSSIVEDDGGTAPLFYAPEAGDYRLLVGSRGVERGDSFFLPADADDLDGDGNTTEPIPFDAAGRRRVRDETVDVGAYEGAEPFVAHRFTGAAGWRMVAPPTAGLTYGDLLASEWTQNVPGADYEGPLSTPSVYLYDETVTTDADDDGDADRQDGWTALPGLADAAPLGRGFVFYAFEDTDQSTPSTQGGFPRQSLVEVTPEDVTDFDWTFAGLFRATSSAGTADISDEDGWNLLGNPFEVGMDWDAASSSGVSASIYVYDPTYGGSGHYRVWDGATGDLADGIVPAGQAFWAKATAAEPFLSVDASARVDGHRTYGRQAQAEPVVVGLQVAGTLGGQALSDAFFLHLDDAASDDVDGTDAFELAPFAGTYLSLASAVGPARLHIDARPASGPVEVPLALTAIADGAPTSAELVLTWTQIRNVPAPWALMLLDTATGQTVDLRTTDRYAFHLAPTAGRVAAPASTQAPAFTASEAPARFRLLVGAAVTATDDRAPAAEVSLVQPNPTASHAMLRVSVPTSEPVQAVVYDALGRQVAVAFDGVVTGTAEIAVEAGRLAPGAYVVRVEGASFAETRPLTVVR